MISIDPLQGTERDNYKLLVGTIIPRPIAFVTTLGDEGVLNGAPFSYFNIVSSNPPMISVSIQHAGGQSKDTARNIKHTKEFVVHIVDQQNVGQVNMTAAPLPPDQSEVSLAGLTPVDSLHIGVPGIKEAKVRMECVLEHCLELPNNDLIIGRIVQFHLDEAIYEQGRINPVALGAVSRLAGNHYAGIGEIFEIERPV
ncbi:flavin reductase family protein [Paenibacillus sp. FSL K6-1217]|uniref:flavin reductase family protein n=1 Tax=Paenibacillus sp. FSL K6-1217 TaxID=2921466 RepID=UPI003246CF39